jgi:hypothetical protein
MFQTLIEKLQKLATNRSVFDPAQLGDPVALQTNWTPTKGGGSNFRTHKLVAANSNRMEFQASFGALAFYFLFLLIGLGVLIAFSIFKFSSGGFSFKAETIVPFLLGLVFATIGGCLLYFGTIPIVFDKREGYFWKGRKAPEEVFDKNAIKGLTHLEEIHALQLISEYCRGNKSSYYSYELNLVLKNGKRINVIDHGNQNKLREDAATLSRFLQKPVWDAI